MIPNFILDVNVLISAAIGKEKSPDAIIYKKFLRSECRLVTSEPLINEFIRVLDYPRVLSLGITPAIASTMIFNLMLLGNHVSKIEKLDWPSLSDKKDWYLLDLLFTSQADALITRDKAVLRTGKKLNLPILKPTDVYKSF